MKEQKPVLKNTNNKKEVIIDKPTKVKISEQSDKQVLTDSPIQLTENAIVESTDDAKDVDDSISELSKEEIQIDEPDAYETISTVSDVLPTMETNNDIIQGFSAGSFTLSEIENENELIEVVVQKVEPVKEQEPISYRGKHYDGGIHF